jgi:hypothetical protein
MAITQTQADQLTSRRFAMLRVTPRRYLSTDATLVSGRVATYQYSFGYPIVVEKLELNGTTMNEVANLAAIIDDSLNTYYAVDEDNGIIYFHVSGGFQAATDHVVAFRHLFYSTAANLYWYEDPADSGTPTRYWEGRLGPVSPIRQSIASSLSGVFSIEASSFEIANSDAAFQREVTSDDSYRDCDVKLWLCIDTPASHQLVFSGRGKRVQVSDRAATLHVYDAFARMRQSCFYGDEAGEAIFSIGGGYFPNMDSKRDGEPCRLILGKHSRWRTRPNRNIAFTCELLDAEYLHEAICTNYDPNISTSTNREWTLCRTKDTIRSVTWGALSSITDSGNIVFASFSNATWASMDVVVGDCVKFTDGAKTAWGRVVRIIQVGGTTWEVTVATNRTTTATFSGSTTITSYPAVSVIIKSNDGNEYGAFYNLDFTVASSATSGGNLRHTLTFVNNFEANPHLGATASVSGCTVALGTLDPGQHRVFFRIRPNVTNASHGTVLKKLCTDAGLATNAASFTAADAAFDADCLMSIPQYDETEYKSILEVAQSIVDSTLGYVTLNDSVEAVYKLLTAPSAGSVVTSSEFAGLSSDVEYADIVTEIYASNPHDYADSNGVGASTASTSSGRAAHLHKLTNVLQMRHVLDTIASRLDEHLAVKSRPTTLYSWRSAARDILLDISEDVTLTDARVLGSDGTVNLKVVGTEKSPREISITAIPVEGL